MAPNRLSPPLSLTQLHELHVSPFVETLKLMPEGRLVLRLFLYGFIFLLLQNSRFPVFNTTFQNDFHKNCKHVKLLLHTRYGCIIIIVYLSASLPSTSHNKHIKTHLFSFLPTLAFYSTLCLHGPSPASVSILRLSTEEYTLYKAFTGVI